MTRHRALDILPWVGWALIVGLCVVVALLWTRLDRQVEENQQNIAQIQASIEVAARRLRDEAVNERAALERRWRDYLMPLLREHHRLLQTVPNLHEPVPPLPNWLKE